MRKWVFVLAIVFCYGFSFGQQIRSIKATDLEKIVSESKGPTIINMWATWCKPCIEEIPYFLEEVKQYNSTRGDKDSIRLILVSLDFKKSYPKDIKEFVKKRKYTAPILWLDETNADYFCPKLDAKWSGAIPATLFINPSNGYRNFFEEQIGHETFRQEIEALVK